MASPAISIVNENDAVYASHKLVRRDVSVAIWPMAVLIYASILPREVSFKVGELFIYADRLALILVLPYVVRKLMEGAIRFVLPDMLVLISSLWMMVAMTNHYGFGPGMRSGGALAFDATVGYYLARISFRSLQDMRKVLILVAPGFFVAGATVMIESVIHRYIVQNITERIFGALPIFTGADSARPSEAGNIRLGLMRGKGPFNHSIHAGIYLASLLPLYAMAGLRGWPKVLGLAASIMSFFSVSSAALLSLASNAFLIGFDRLQRIMREFTWRGLIIVVTALSVMTNIVTSSGVVGLIGRYLTFDPFTAYYRQLTWRYGVQSVIKHPLFGIGFESYERPAWMTTESIDAHWLLLAMRFGLIPSLGLLLASIIALMALAQASIRATSTDQRFYRGIAITLFSLVFAMFSVSLWGNLQTWFNILLGGCVACAQHSYRRVRISQSLS